MSFLNISIGTLKSAPSSTNCLLLLLLLLQADAAAAAATAASVASCNLQLLTVQVVVAN